MQLYSVRSAPPTVLLREQMPQWLLRLTLYGRLFDLQSKRTKLANAHDRALVVLGGQHRQECGLLLSISQRRDGWKERLARAQRVADRKTASGSVAEIEGMEEALLDELELEVLAHFSAITRLADQEADDGRLDPGLRQEIRKFLQKLDALYDLAVALIKLGPVTGIFAMADDDVCMHDSGSGWRAGRDLALDPRT